MDQWDMPVDRIMTSADERESLMSEFVRLDGQVKEGQRKSDSLDKELDELRRERSDVRERIRQALGFPGEGATKSDGELA